jgi:hypothetical protein
MSSTLLAFKTPVPMEVVPFRSVTVPLVTGVGPDFTVAVKVTLCPAVIALAELVNAVVVLAAVTVSVPFTEVTV